MRGKRACPAIGATVGATLPPRRTGHGANTTSGSTASALAAPAGRSAPWGDAAVPGTARGFRAETAGLPCILGSKVAVPRLSPGGDLRRLAAEIAQLVGDHRERLA